MPRASDAQLNTTRDLYAAPAGLSGMADEAAILLLRQWACRLGFVLSRLPLGRSVARSVPPGAGRAQPSSQDNDRRSAAAPSFSNQRPWLKITRSGPQSSKREAA